MTKEQILEEKRLSYNKGYLDGKQELAKELERYEELKAKYDSVVMDNMTHEYNAAESERHLPELIKQYVDAERERAGKLVEAAKSVIESWSNRMNVELEHEKTSPINGDKYWSPVSSQVDSYAINKLRQTLTELKALLPSS